MSVDDHLTHHHPHSPAHQGKTSGVGGAEPWPGWAEFLWLLMDRQEQIVKLVPWDWIAVGTLSSVALLCGLALMVMGFIGRLQL